MADRDRAQVDVEAARADLAVAQAEERLAQVNVDYGQIKAPFKGVITQRNIGPGDYLQPGGGTRGRPLFVLEQINPVRVFVGIPELASYFVHDQDTAIIRFQAIPGITREGKVVRSGFSFNPATRTLQTEIDLPNSDGHLHPGLVRDRLDRHHPQAGLDAPVQRNRLPGRPELRPLFRGQWQARPHSGNRRPSRRHATEILKKHVPNANTNDWPTLDGTERNPCRKPRCARRRRRRGHCLLKGRTHVVGSG